ncbi:MAG: MMPL family transporter, partial [Halobaculum sp.]
MSAFDRFVGLVTGYSKTMIAVMLVATALVSAGAPMVEQASSLDQFQTDSVEADKLDYIEANFSTGPSNTTTAQVIQRQPNGNVLDKESLLASLRYQRTLRTNDETAASLAGDQPTVGIANVIARTAIVREEAADVRRLASEVQRRNASIQRRRAALERNRTALREDRRALRNRSAAVNATSERLRAGLVELRENPSLSVDNVFDRVKANSSVALNETDRAIYREAAADLRNATTDRQASAAFRLGTRGVLADDLRALQRDRAALRERAKRLSERADQLEADVATLRETVDELKAERAELRNATNASLAAQIDQIRSMNASEIDETIGVVLGEGGDSGPFAFMPTDYEPGSTEASATVILVTQEASVANAGSGAASEALTDAQLAMERLAGDRADGHEYLVFGAGIINDEISSSQTDSLLIVGPLALLFVVIALIVAYRDLLDILLGLFGIGAVLGWTFGFMGWAGIDFNQIFVAVPVLLIGLSIDYAIHVFMRHREERTGSGDGPRESMTVALSGVGVALVWVTATTVIGFLSNLVSPVGPIREFGIVSSVGITAAFLVFTVLTPALKVELDELLEGWGVNREKQAFGTGGGAFSAALSVGSTAARRAPLAVIVLALVVTGAAAVGGSQVDTSFSQEDFLAEQPPEWTNELPEPFDPGEYTAKATLQFVNENFVRQNSQAQILIESDGRSVASARALQRVATAEETAASKDVTLVLSNGEPDVRSPLSVMEAVAAENATFNATFTAADTDGDGVPDRNVREVYDTLYTVAPDRAASVIQRENGEYRALRIVVSVKGGSSGEAITTQMRDVASTVNGPGFTVTATGSAILNKIVQDELLQTVIESLIITLVAVFLFLMITYRITEGSASLGAVTLLPVAFSVAWILGTMFLAGIPFNVLTGLITSLTVGLGVAYSIHLSERYNQELERTGDVWEAMETAVTGTGGALLGSAATTVGGFGTLAFAILPPLQQFGIITGMTIVYAFLAAVLVLPSLLVVWTRVFGPDDAAAQIVGDAPDDG